MLRHTVVRLTSCVSCLGLFERDLGVNDSEVEANVVDEPAQRLEQRLVEVRVVHDNIVAFKKFALDPFALELGDLLLLLRGQYGLAFDAEQQPSQVVA